MSEHFAAASSYAAPLQIRPGEFLALADIFFLIALLVMLLL